MNPIIIDSIKIIIIVIKMMDPPVPRRTVLRHSKVQNLSCNTLDQRFTYLTYEL